MKLTKKLVAATALTGLLAAAGTLRAADTSPALTMKPNHGISFDVGSKRAVSYFLSDNGTCKLVLTLAEAPNWEAPSWNDGFTAIRFEAAIPAGKATRFNPAEGKAFKFACQAGAQSMSVWKVEEVAYSGGG